MQKNYNFFLNLPIHIKKYFHPSSLNQLIYAHVQYAESQKRSAKGSNLKEDDSALPLWIYYCYVVTIRRTVVCPLAWKPEQVHFNCNILNINIC